MKIIYKVRRSSQTIFVYSPIIIMLLFTFLILLGSCKKFLDINPPKDRIDRSKVFENDETATSAVIGVYSQMAGNTLGFASGGNSSVSVLGGLSADELKSYSDALKFFSENQIQTNDSKINNVWRTAYNYIYTANAIIEGLAVVNGVSESTKKQLLGEAKFIRAFCYFYLTNLFGDVPLILNTNYKVNENAPKSSSATIYSQTITDLLDAETLLSDSYVTNERVRPNKWVAKSLLSRVYLYTEKWDLAAQKASEVINHKVLYTLVNDLDKVFLKNSTEAIWQLVPPAGQNTTEGGFFILTATPTSVSLSPDLLAAFDNSLDNRKNVWIKELNNTTGRYSYSYKYKIRTSSLVTVPVTEYSMVIRLAELHLIRAEAKARLGQVEPALDDINIIRRRAGIVTPVTGLNPLQCLMEIRKQRRLELFTEWGHRWLDLKRTVEANTILPPLKGSSWQNTDVLYPIPDEEINRNINLIQNLGY
ncbi:RagB/SusD family nutrient uptake outer membrane protein [Pedobacter nyackensis]|uniref:SusD family protein n=1 Tax=Pedobacter nyackensis TaxID=475255 RepID=A0A1W2DL07_9SPHI|nr:RagB/SusD family nutrient uptake outer membrane protein [Pedobacter nyackensis]SMC98103.1 SusD family protein [Pedobacter nyackensis]